MKRVTVTLDKRGNSTGATSARRVSKSRLSFRTTEREARRVEAEINDSGHWAGYKVRAVKLADCR